MKYGPPSRTKAPRCPLCEQALSNRRRKLVNDKIDTDRESQEAAAEEAAAGTPGYRIDSKSGLVLPTKPIGG